MIIKYLAHYGCFQISYQLKIMSHCQKIRKVSDPIHGFIRLDQEIWKIIDTPEFQRLREIKQLGAEYMVFPSATHSRFEHCIGTAYLCQTYMDILIEKYGGENGIYYPNKKQAMRDRRIVTLAGLLHDIGHGPFSHMFDNEFIKKTTKIKVQNGKQEEWSHELAGEFIIKGLYNKYHKTKLHQPIFVFEGKELTQKEVRRIIRLINGIPKDRDTGEVDAHNLWQYEIVSNDKTGVDTDKLDYFRRDSFYLGIKNVFIEHELLMKQTRIVEVEENGNKVPRLSYPVKYADKVLDLFHSRYKLYKGYYQNRIVQGIEIMLCKVFEKINQKYSIRTICDNIFKDYEPYCSKLTDNLIFQVLRSDDKDLKEARQILLKLQTRKIYCYVAETDNLGDSDANKFFDLEQKQIKEKIWKSGDKSFSLNDFEVRKSKLTYGGKKDQNKKEKHPIEAVIFYDKRNPDKKCDFDPNRMSILKTARVSERMVRVYIQNGHDEEKFFSVEAAFKKLTQVEYNLPACFFSGTPRKVSELKSTKEVSFKGGMMQ